MTNINANNKAKKKTPETFAEVIASLGGIKFPRRNTPPTTTNIAILSPDANDDDAPYDSKTIYATNGISQKKLKGLCKQSPGRTADLHGYTADAAWAELEDFLSAAIADGIQHVEIVHGRGAHNPDGRAVLRGKTRKWLTQSKFILGYIQNPHNEGATHALLRLS